MLLDLAGWGECLCQISGKVTHLFVHGKNAPHPVYIAFVFLIIFAECDAAEHLQDIADGCFIVRAARHCRFVFYHWVFQRWYVPFGLKTAEQRRKVAFAMTQLIR